MNIVQTLTKALDSITAPTPKPKGSDVEVMVDALVELAKADLLRVIPGPMKEAVRSEQAKGQCQQLIRDSGEDTVLPAFLAQQSALSKQAANGKLSVDDVWDLSDFVEDFSNRRRAALDAWQRIDRQQEPTRQQVVEMFLQIVGSYIKEIEETDRAAYERFGLTYPGSSLPALLRSAIPFIQNRSFALIVAAVK